MRHPRFSPACRVFRGGPRSPPRAPFRCGPRSPRRKSIRRKARRRSRRVWKERATLAGKTVILRGKVVKFNGGILGVNWIHIQDGTGTAADANQRRHGDERGRDQGRRHHGTGTVAAISGRATSIRFIERHDRHLAGIEDAGVAALLRCSGHRRYGRTGIARLESSADAADGDVCRIRRSGRPLVPRNAARRLAGRLFRADVPGDCARVQPAVDRTRL